MAQAVFRLQLPDGEVRLARGDVVLGPEKLLTADLTIGALLRDGRDAVTAAARPGSGGEAVPAGATLLAPVDDQEVWAAGVTYGVSREARMEESREADVYDRVWQAERPELFFKAAGWRVRGPGQAVGVRVDSEWDVPEPELALVLSPDGALAAYTIANDVSSRSIEGENPLYLPQAKVYDGACALGPALVPASEVDPPFEIEMTVIRDGGRLVRLKGSTADMKRTFTELAAHLGCALTFPAGVVLLTGTSLVPPEPFTLTERDEVAITIDGLGTLVNSVEVTGARA